MSDYTTYSFRTKKEADYFQEICRQNFLLTERANNYDVLLYIKNAKPCVHTLAQKCCTETICKFSSKKASNAFIDKIGAVRHAMNVAELKNLYKGLERFIADMTRGEYEEYECAFKGVMTAIHERINNN